MFRPEIVTFMHFPNILLKQVLAFSGRIRETFPVCTLSAVTLVHGWVRWMFGILSQLIIPVELL